MPASPDDWVAGSIADAMEIRAILVGCARGRAPISYSGLLDLLGHRFTRPKMRALCRTLDRIDEAARAAGEPDLAVLVVRESDGLPGQGWWVAHAHACGYEGPRTGPPAAAFVRERQERAFVRWAAGGRGDALPVPDGKAPSSWTRHAAPGDF